MIAQGGEGDSLRGLIWSAHAHWAARTPVFREAPSQPDVAEDEPVDVDDIPYVVPPLEIVATFRVHVEDIGELPAMPYPIDDEDVPVED